MMLNIDPSFCFIMDGRIIPPQGSHSSIAVDWSPNSLSDAMSFSLYHPFVDTTYSFLHFVSLIEK